MAKQTCRMRPLLPHLLLTDGADTDDGSAARRGLRVSCLGQCGLNQREGGDRKMNAVLREISQSQCEPRVNNCNSSHAHGRDRVSGIVRHM